MLPLVRELVDEYGYLGSCASLRRRVVLLGPAVTGEPILRFETGPGIQTQGDWADVGARPLGEGTADLFAFVGSSASRGWSPSASRPTYVASLQPDV